MSTWVENLGQSLKLPWIHLRSREITAASLVSIGPSMLFIAEWFALIVLSIIQYRHFALTLDFSYYHQAWYLIAHGELNPNMLIDGSPFYKNHLELFLWLMAPLYWLWPHSFWLLVAEDTGIAGASWVAWLWIRSMVEGAREISRRVRGMALTVALILLLVNPWMIQAITFPFHFEDLTALFLIAAAWSFYRDKNTWGWVWTAAVISTGNVSMTYVVALGISLVLMDHGRRRRGWVAIGLGLFAFLAASHLGVNLGAAIPAATGSSRATHATHHNLLSGASGLLVGLLLHPGAIFKALFPHRLNIYANLAPEGFLGLFTPWGFPIALVVLLENNLPAFVNFTLPGFQSFPMYPFLIVGSAQVLLWVLRRRRWLGVLLSLGLAVNVAGWAYVWTPHIVPSALESGISPQAASVLQQLRRTIPPSSEVVASQGIIGRFAGRKAYDVFQPSIPLVRHRVFFIVSPYQGIDLASATAELQRIVALERLPNIRLLTNSARIWAFSWNPPHGMKTLTLRPGTAVQAWTLASAVGTPVMTGPFADWHMTTASAQPGYVAQQAYWRLKNGVYRAIVRVSDTGPANLEVWNATGNVLLQRTTLPTTNGTETLTISFRVNHQYPANTYKGRSVFAMEPTPLAHYENQIELRVWTPGNEVVNVYSLAISGGRDRTVKRLVPMEKASQKVQKPIDLCNRSSLRIRSGIRTTCSMGGGRFS